MATEVLEDVHVAVEVMFPVVPSLYVAVAVNCCVEPTSKVVAAGVTAIDEMVLLAPVTVRAAEPLTLFTEAVMLVEPTAARGSKPRSR